MKRVSAAQSKAVERRRRRVTGLQRPNAATPAGPPARKLLAARSSCLGLHQHCHTPHVLREGRPEGGAHMGVTELRDHHRTRPAPLPGSVGGSPLYRRWLTTGLWIVPLVLALSVATALVVTSRQTPIYRSAAVVAVVPSATVPNGPEVFRSLEALEGRTVIADRKSTRLNSSH